MGVVVVIVVVAVVVVVATRKTGTCINYSRNIQESLANAKVNTRQHCVSLSCLGDEDSENIASERYENRHLRQPLSCLTPHTSRTPANICITLILLETTFTGLHFHC